MDFVALKPTTWNLTYIHVLLFPIVGYKLALAAVGHCMNTVRLMLKNCVKNILIRRSGLKLFS